MITTLQRNQFSTFSFYPNFVSLNAGHSPADLIDTGLPAEDLRQRVNSGDCGSDTSGSRYFGSSENGDNRYAPAADPRQAYTLYPNPNVGNFTLMQQLPDNEPIHAELFDALGNKVKTIEISFTSYWLPLNLKGLPPGLYLLHIMNSKLRTFNLKFIVE